MLLGLLFCFRRSDYTVNIASNANDSVELKSNSVLTQAWLSDKKEIHGMNIVFAEQPQFDGWINLEVLDEDNIVLRKERKRLSEINGDTLEILFDKIVVNEPTEFEIKLYFESMEDKFADSIFLKVNNNYSGLFIDDSEQHSGLASQIVYSKNRSLFAIIALLWIIYSFAFCLMDLFKREFSEVIGVVILTIGVVLYICGLIINVEVGMKFLQLLSVIGFLYLLYSILIGKFQIKNIFSFEVLAVVAFLVFSIIYNYHTIILESDEFSHWAIAAKDMFYSNMLPSHDGTTVSFTRYPPFMALIQYFFMYFNQVFSEKFLFIAYQFAGFCLLAVWSGKKKNSNILVKILITANTVLFPLIFYSRYYNLIMIDGFLGIVFAYVLYCYFYSELDKFNIFRISIGLAALVLTKEMGIVLGGIACLIFLLCEVKEKKEMRGMIIIVVMGIVTLLVFSSWQLYTHYNIPDNNNSLSSAVEMLQGDGNAKISQEEIEFGEKVVLSGLKQVTCNIKVGLFSYILFLFTLIFVIYMMEFKENEKKFTKIFLYLIIGNLLYFCILLFLYIKVFSEGDALTTASIDRYLFSYLLGVTYVFVGFFLNVVAKKKKEPVFIMVIMFGIILFNVSFEDVLSLNKFVGKKQELIWGYDDIEENFHGFAHKDDKVFFWCDNATQMSYRIFKFSVCPIRTQESNVGWSFLHYDMEKNKTVVWDYENIEKTLADYEYVYIANYEKNERETYAKLFEDAEEIMVGGIYRVQRIGSELKLIKIGYSPIMRFY